MSVLNPFPEGWYFVASRKSILKAKLIQRTWMGEEIVAWCDDAGRVCVSGAVCPHLGSDLGPAAGGKVRDGCLVCPFHGFEFDVSGKCVATPFAPAPRAARLNVYEAQVANGMVFAWWGIDGRPPHWHLPELPVDSGEWTELGFRTLRFPGHPQETTENAVDLAHLKYVHGYDKVRRVGDISVDGACFTRRLDFRRIQNVAGITNIAFDTSAMTRLVGLGFSLVEIHERSIDMHSRLWVLATPIDGKLIELVLASQVREMRKPKRPLVGLRFMPLGLRAKIMNSVILSFQKNDVMQDVVIWSRKQYLPHPRLCRADGEIGKYRRWCKQFYPNDRNSPARQASQPAA